MRRRVRIGLHFRICCQITSSNNKQRKNVPLPLHPLPPTSVTSAETTWPSVASEFLSFISTFVPSFLTQLSPCCSRALSEHFQGTFRAIKWNCSYEYSRESNFGSVSEQSEDSYRAIKSNFWRKHAGIILEKLQSSSRAHQRSFTSNIRAVSEQLLSDYKGNLHINIPPQFQCN